MADHTTRPRSAIARLDQLTDYFDARRSAVWTAAVGLFVVGDLLTTGVGVRYGSIVEAGPVAAPLLSAHGFWMMLPLKAAALAIGAGLYATVPRPYDVGAPLGLAAVGVIVVGWNLVMIALTIA
ncbi:hypothetical protein SAMN05192561_103282 [Halopenitus malekzadehii]|uniref:DUF5658 domain-containing protein n=1 Tax=Halopenitus malekzadehii TaxID=1267564 RepID=A0A1H6IW05_9EURY|nr:hypothetical protein [Halopenitus malekzadehii]SEH50836.1 hypothetical protein SAMN05192561_103282 [Halopenitus malekzadehii]